jgi:hypothetical protein
LASSKLDLAKLKSDLQRELKRRALETVNGISSSQRVEIGNTVIAEMKNLIAKGISPIAEKGRYAAYKWVGISNQINKAAKNLSGPSRAHARQKAASIKSDKYPYSVMGKYPQKRERPVNLFLSGKFLRDLEARANSRGVTIGFKTELSELKESGHREGVNGQPQRPIIPQGNEKFSPSIYKKIVDALTTAIRKSLRS